MYIMILKLNPLYLNAWWSSFELTSPWTSQNFKTDFTMYGSIFGCSRSLLSPNNDLIRTKIISAQSFARTIHFYCYVTFSSSVAEIRSITRHENRTCKIWWVWDREMNHILSQYFFLKFIRWLPSLDYEGQSNKVSTSTTEAYILVRR